MKRRGGLFCAAIIALGVVCAWGTTAASQDINELNIDFFTGPLLTSSRAIGLGGAYTGIGEGAAGHLSNPASYGMRHVYDADDTWAWDFDFSFLDDAGKNDLELDLSGRGLYESANFGQLGVDVKWERLGGGFHTQFQTYIVSAANQDGFLTTYEYDQRFVSLGAGFNFRKGEIVLGFAFLGGTATLSELDDKGERQGSIEMIGGGIQVGVLWVRPDKNYRFGFNFRSPIQMTQDQSDNFSGELVNEFGELRVPASVVIPFEAALGFSYLFGPREYNVAPTFGRWYIRGEEKPKRLAQRRYLLFSSDLVVTGPAVASIGVQDFLAQEVQQSGRTISLSPRVGVESEFWEDVMAARAGSYFEPSRFDRRIGRPHLTGGIDWHFSLYWEWRLGLTFDVAEKYSNIGVGLGFWH